MSSKDTSGNQSTDEHECDECDRVFGSVQALNSHRGHAHNPRIDIECVVCGDAFEVRPSRKDRRTCCSPECKSQRISEAVSGENHYLFIDSPVECDNCGTVFQKKPSAITETNFCCWDCNSEWLSENVVGEDTNLWNGGTATVECDWCGSDIERKPSGVGERNFCNQACYGEWESVHYVGMGNPRWRGGSSVYFALRSLRTTASWSKISEETRKESGRCCEMCGKSVVENGRELSAHHIIPVLCGGLSQSENLISLCIGCHRRAELYVNSIPEVTPIVEYGDC